MARVTSSIHLSGTLGDVTFYQVGGKCYARMKTSLDKQRFYRDQAYAGLPMMRVKNFGRASQLASRVYRTLPRAQKNRGLFNKLTALGHEWLWNGITEEEVVLRLREALTKMTASLAKPEPKGEVAASEAAYPPLDLPQRTTLLSKWWVSHQGALYQPLQISNKEGLLQRALQPLRTGWLRAYPKRE